MVGQGGSPVTVNTSVTLPEKYMIKVLMKFFFLQIVKVKPLCSKRHNFGAIKIYSRDDREM